MNKIHFSSQNMKWNTPDEIYRELDKEFKFDFDPCPANEKDRYNSGQSLNGLPYDGLQIEWGRSNFVNPPYGREIGKWVAKGYAEALKGKTVVLLIPSRTDSKWWHNYIMKSNEIRFIKGRLKFKGAKWSAPFPSAIVIFKESS